MNKTNEFRSMRSTKTLLSPRLTRICVPQVTVGTRSVAVNRGWKFPTAQWLSTFRRDSTGAHTNQLCVAWDRSAALGERSKETRRV